MSAKLMGQVWDLDLPSNEQSVLLAMADHADHNGGNVFPSNGLLAWKLGISDDTVTRLKRKLEERGVLVEVSSAPGVSKHYRIDISKGILKSPFAPKRPVRGQTNHPQIAGGSDMSTTRKSAPDHPQTPSQPPAELCGTNHQREPSNEPKSRKANFVRPSLDDVLEFCAKNKISAVDGEAFWNSKEGSGWKGVKDWPATIRSWKLHGYLASQKQSQRNSSGYSRPYEKSLAEKLCDEATAKCEAAVKWVHPDDL